MLIEYAGFFFVPLTSRLVNDDSTACRKLTGLAIKSLLAKVRKWILMLTVLMAYAICKPADSKVKSCTRFTSKEASVPAAFSPASLMFSVPIAYLLETDCCFRDVYYCSSFRTDMNFESPTLAAFGKSYYWSL